MFNSCLSKDNHSYKNDLCLFRLKTAVIWTKCPVLCEFRGKRTLCPVKEFKILFVTRLDLSTTVIRLKKRMWDG